MPYIAASFVSGLLIYKYYSYFPDIIFLISVSIPVGLRLTGWSARRVVLAASTAVAAVACVQIHDSYALSLNLPFMFRVDDVWRTRLTEIIYRSMSQDSAALHAALITGVRTGISPEIREAFNATGLVHLLSISGTHFGLLAVVIFSSIRSLLKAMPERLLNVMTIHITPTQVAALLSLPFLGLYLIISGAGVPALRAMIMTSTYMTALLTGKKGRWIDAVSVAAMVILMWQPHALFELSFLLSFTAVLSIGLAADRRMDRGLKGPAGVPEKRRPLNMIGIGTVRGLAITVSVTLGTAPIVLNTFGSLPVYAPVTNLLITPVVCFVILPAGLFTATAAAVFGLPVMPLNGLTDDLTRLCLYFIKQLSLLPMSRACLAPPPLMVSLLYYVGLLMVLKGRGAGRFIPLILAFMVYLIPALIHDDGLAVTFLDVGQGDSAVVELPDGKVMLIDGGSAEARSGSRRIEPFLRSKWIHTIDYLVITHNHPDHIGGLTYIVDRFRIGEVWISGKNITAMRKLLTEIYERHIPVRMVQRGDYLDMGSYLIVVLHPAAGITPGHERVKYADENNDSLVFRIESAGGSILFPGDIHEEVEQELISLGPMIDADVIKVPHHGSRTSALEGFIDLVSPQVAIISVGRHNPFGHPHEETLMTYESRGVSIFRTDRDGSITVNLQRHDISVRTTGGRRLKKAYKLKDEIENLLSLLS
jgi:competence protein ComEC